MRNLQFIRHQLIKMLAVGKTDIFMQHQTVNDSQNTVHAVYCQQDNIPRVIAQQNQFSQQEQNNKGYSYRTHISGKAFRSFPEIEYTENHYRHQHHPQQLWWQD